jgi:pyruvate/2-oxoglutarate/acetoin dehydrogenase E1 component
VGAGIHSELVVPNIRYSQALNSALREEMKRDPAVVIYGEDIATYGGVFRVTQDLLSEFGPERVLDTPISEATLTGMAVGASMMGLKPVLEIMYADFLPLCLDALVNQASPARFIWAGQVSLPFVLRTQGGIGVGAGAQHSKSLDAMVAHIPGIKVVAPAFPLDAKALLIAAIRDPDPVVFLEHKLLYNTIGEVPDDVRPGVIGRAVVLRLGTDVTVIASSRMVLEALKAADRLSELGCSAEVIDIVTLRPLDVDTICSSVRKTRHAVVVNEGWRFCGYAAELSAMVAEQCFFDLDAPVQRIGTFDRAIPKSPPLESAAVPGSDSIVAAALATKIQGRPTARRT